MIPFIVSILLNSCQSNINREEDQSIIEIPPHFGNAEIIRNPISPEGLMDTNLLAKILFEKTTHHFGEVRSGKKVSHTFKFKNIGMVPLVINNASANCGCTVTQFPVKPILSGEKDSIKVIFDTSGRLGKQLKKINIFANTFPSTNILELKGEILK